MIKCQVALGGVHPRRGYERMKRHKIRAFAPLSAVSFLLVLAVFSGCRKEQDKPVYASRTRDPAYKQELQGVIDQRTQTAKTLYKLKKQMDLLAARARAALPAGATDEQAKAELDGNPAKYPGWKILSAEFAKVSAAAEKELADARSLVRRRIMKETADRKAAAAQGETAAKKPAVSK